MTLVHKATATEIFFFKALLCKKRRKELLLEAHRLQTPVAVSTQNPEVPIRGMQELYLRCFRVERPETAASAGW
jgi:hypothetical protein